MDIKKEIYRIKASLHDIDCELLKNRDDTSIYYVPEVIGLSITNDNNHIGIVNGGRQCLLNPHIPGYMDTYAVINRVKSMNTGKNFKCEKVDEPKRDNTYFSKNYNESICNHSNEIERYHIYLKDTTYVFFEPSDKFYDVKSSDLVWDEYYEIVKV